jgi:DNA-directed RNA polymerase subunit RPC12/RpoP
MGKLPKAQARYQLLPRCQDCSKQFVTLPKGAARCFDCTWKRQCEPRVWVQDSRPKEGHKLAGKI